MKPASLEQAIFAEVLLRDTPEARAAYLDAACGFDQALRRRIQALLYAAEEAGDFLEKPPDGLGRPGGVALIGGDLIEKPGDRIGRYKLLEKIGEGGCGVVYMAEQDEPVHRRVALKIIKLGMDTRSVVARFEAERQALALMDHPNIARVFDGGATQTGRPYFVMELVRGVRITEFCDQTRLPTKERLRLFMQVCHAIQHAHQKGIIHRDLKPSNILVTINDGAPVPKVIDFGIAKATGQRLTDKTLFTQFHSFMGTPAYTSPEQAEMSSVDVDTRSDIYSLGVLLYELLTGCTPFDGGELLRSGLDEMRRVIRNEEPPKPSERVTRELLRAKEKEQKKRETRAASHGRGSGKSGVLQQGARRACQPAIPSDLDWIVMKCLEKDRSRRYETANGIAGDVQRHLDNEPILARPPSHAYRIRKFVRRNKSVFAAVVGITMALVGGIAASTWQAVRAHRGEARVKAALAELRASAPAYAAQARGLAGRQQFAEAIEKLDYAIRLRPDTAEYLVAKANLLECQLRFGDAAPVYRAALSLDPNDARARTNLFLCEQLRSLDRADAQWHDLLGRLYVVMTTEQRPWVELKLISGLVRDHVKKQLAALDMFVGHSLDERLTFKEGTYVYLRLDLTGMAIHDLRPLEGLPLLSLDASDTAVVDLRPLEPLPLMQLHLSRTKVTDLGPLRGMKGLRSLSLRDSAVSDLSPLQGLSIAWLDLNGTRVGDLSALRGAPLRVLRLKDTLVQDLSPLAQMPLFELDCTSIPARDFSVLASCRDLASVFLSGTAVKELDMLRGCKLVGLLFDGTAVRDLSPLAGMPLEIIRFYDTQVSDVAPLLKCPKLQNIGYSQSCRNIELLRALPNLRRISTRRGEPEQPASEFWAALDAKSRK